MTRTRIVIALVVLALGLMTAPALAQDALPGDVIIDGLRNPRNLSYDADGNLYIAEAGIAGAEMTSSDTAYGATSRVVMVTPDGEMDVVVEGLVSWRGGNSLGATAIQVTDESLWVLLGESFDSTLPFNNALIELDKETGRVKNFIDLLTPELELDPDGNDNEESNPTDFAVAPDGTIIIAAAGCNCLMSWTEADGVQIAASWPFASDNPVPTSVEFGPDGDLYVGFLTGFPFPEGGSRIERWSGGELVETYEGLTAVTGLLVTDDGTIYATEYGVFNQGWGPGRVVMVSADGVTPVLEGIPTAFGLAQSPDGTLVVSANSAGAEASGAILAVPMMP